VGDTGGAASLVECTGGSRVTILHYPKVSSQDTDGAVSLEAFEEQMQHLSGNGYMVQTLSQLLLEETDEALHP